jgi:hypothetical protein
VVAEKQKQTLIVTVFPISSTNASRMRKGVCCVGVVDSDSDSDKVEVLDCRNKCPNDIDEMVPGLRGCGEVNMDFESDEVPDGNDECLQDPAKTLIGKYGCEELETYSDSDGVPYCNDEFLQDSNKSVPCSWLRRSRYGLGQQQGDRLRRKTPTGP